MVQAAEAKPNLLGLVQRWLERTLPWCKAHSSPTPASHLVGLLWLALACSKALGSPDQPPAPRRALGAVVLPPRERPYNEELPRGNIQALPSSSARQPSPSRSTARRRRRRHRR